MASTPTPVDPADNGGPDGTAPIKLEPKRYWAVVIFVHVLIVAVALFRDQLGEIRFNEDLNVQYGDLLLVLLGLYWLEAWHPVQTDQIGGIIVLEHEAMEVKRGWKWTPRFLTELPKIPRGFQQNEFPGEPEQISNIADKDEFRTQMLKPIRITTGDAQGDDSDILGSRLTYEPRVTVEWCIQWRGVFEFIIHIPGATVDDKLAFIFRVLRDSAQKALELELPKYSAGQAIDNRERITRAVKRRLVKETKEWGIAIREVGVLNLVPDHETNIALSKIPQAKAAARAVGIAAIGEKNRLTREGEGRGAARKAELVGEGEGIRQAANDSGVSADVYRAGEVADKVAKAGNLILGVEGVTQVVGLAEHIARGGPRGGGK